MTKKKYFGLFFDENGEYLGKQKFNRNEKKFKFGKKTFLIKLKEGSYFERKGVFYNKRYYFYNVNHSHPLSMSDKKEKNLDPEDFSTLLETNHLKKLNDVNKSGLGDLLTPRNILIGLVIIIGLILISTGNLI